MTAKSLWYTVQKTNLCPFKSAAKQQQPKINNHASCIITVLIRNWVLKVKLYKITKKLIKIQK